MKPKPSNTRKTRKYWVSHRNGLPAVVKVTPATTNLQDASVVVMSTHDTYSEARDVANALNELTQ